MELMVLDLFSGIGGFSLGLERAGMKTVAFCEIEEFPRNVLNKHWPGIPVARDIKKLKYENGILYENGVPIYAGTIDVICGGFPCQPFSHAGQRKGTADVRDLWPEMFRLICEVRPRWVIGENVAGFIAMGLERTIADLEGQAYEVQPVIIPAVAVGAPHRRDRVWILGSNTKSIRTQGRIFQQGGRSIVGEDGKVQPVAHSGGDAPRTSYGPGGGRSANQKQNHRHQIWDDIGNGGEDVANTAGWQSRKSPQSKGRQNTGGGSEKINGFLPHPEIMPQRSRLRPGGPARKWCGRFSHHRGENGIFPDPKGYGCKPDKPERGNKLQQPHRQKIPQVGCGQFPNISNAVRNRSQARIPRKEEQRKIKTESKKFDHNSEGYITRSDFRAVESGLGGSIDGVSAWLDGSWEAGIPRIAIKVTNRTKRLKGIGNAVVPQVVEMIGRAIMETENG